VGDLTTTNLLLVVVAVMAVLQAVVVTIALVTVSRTSRRLAGRIDEIERTMAPIAARALVIMDRVDRISERVDEGTEKLDAALAVTARGAELALSHVNGGVKSTVGLVAALTRGVKAARDAWREGSRRSGQRPARMRASTLRVVERPAGELPVATAANVARRETGPPLGG
jgi:uncharacterized protein YoxC